MKILLTIIIVLMSSQAFAFSLNPFKEKKCEEPKVIECSYSLNWHEDERQRKRLFIFSVKTTGECGKLVQVGELNEQNHQFRQYKGQVTVFKGEYVGDKMRKDLIKDAWGDLSEIEFYEEK